MMESGREHNAREDIEAEVRILVLVQMKNGPVLQETDAATPVTPNMVESMKAWVRTAQPCVLVGSPLQR